MFVVFGWGQVTKRCYGYTPLTKCDNCGRTSTHGLLCVRTWFNLFFVPVVPYDTKWLCVCPVCQSGYMFTKEDFMAMVNQSREGALEVTTQRAVGAPRIYVEPLPAQSAIPTEAACDCWKCRCGNVNPSASLRCLKCGRSPEAVI